MGPDILRHLMAEANYMRKKWLREKEKKNKKGDFVILMRNPQVALKRTPT